MIYFSSILTFSILCLCLIIYCFCKSASKGVHNRIQLPLEIGQDDRQPYQNIGAQVKKAKTELYIDTGRKNSSTTSNNTDTNGLRFSTTTPFEKCVARLDDTEDIDDYDGLTSNFSRNSVRKVSDSNLQMDHIN